MSMKRRHTLAVLTAVAAACALPFGAAHAADAKDGKDDAKEAAKVITQAQATLADLLKSKDFDSLRAGIKQAKGVLIYPKVLKAGFFLGGSGGTGVLLVREGKNDWSQPAFYTVGSVSFGLQFGGQDSQMVVLINSQKAIDSLMANSLKLGGDASAAVGPVGQGQAANVTADFVSYSKAKGAFLGMSIEGSVLDVRGALNRAYYGREVTPIEILSKKSVSNKGSAALRKALATAAG
jgi:SH3 domain-containing YSC84-like protein 1